jgi:transcriptional regulator with XRE-family HTH domain
MATNEDVKNYALINARKNAGLTQGQLARRVGLNSIESYRRYEAYSFVPNKSLMLRIAEVLGVNIDSLWPQS